MKKITIDRIMETSYEDNTSWIEYEVNGKFGYEIVEDVTEEDMESIEQYYNQIYFEMESAINKGIDITPIVDKCKKSNNRVWRVAFKPHISVCSKFLEDMIESCRQSDNDMWYMDTKDMIEYVEGNKEKYNSIMDNLEDEIDSLGLKGYVTINEYGYVVTVFGGSITKFLF